MIKCAHNVHNYLSDCKKKGLRGHYKASEPFLHAILLSDRYVVLQQPFISKGEISLAPVPNYYMIQNLYTKQFSRLYKSCRQRSIFLAWRWVARRVIVST